MPAAAVIPVPVVSVVDVAVKRSVADGLGALWGHCMVGREVKCHDPDWTNRGEGGVLASVVLSKTKAGGSKLIRYRCSSSSKRWRLWCMFCVRRAKA